MLMRTGSVLFGFVLLACGGSEPSGDEGSEPSGGEQAADSERPSYETSEVHFTLGDSQLSGGAQLHVREENPVVNLIVTGVYEENTSDLVSFQLGVLGVENVVGFHRVEVGPPSNSEAFAVAYLDQQSYSSRSGMLEVTLAGDASISGSLEAELFKDSEPGKLDETGERITIAVNFEGSWSLVCRSPVPNLPGDHSRSDSGYCRDLRF